MNECVRWIDRPYKRIGKALGKTSSFFIICKIYLIIGQRSWRVLPGWRILAVMLQKELRGLKKRIVKQVGMCLLIIIALAIGKVSGADILETGTDVILNQMAEDYSGEDIAQIAEGGARAVSSIPDKVDDAIVFVTGKPLYGDPIEKYSGDRASVFAVGNGQVTAAGENETIGKYVKITHGSDGESLYGNLDEVFAKVPSNVKKGQIIGTYRESAGKDFYYSFTEFD